MTDTPRNNVYLTGSLASVFLKTASPIILIMLVNGSFSLVDAYFLGIYVGADALTAVTAMFPAFMFIVALSTLVSNGFASVMARLIGADNTANAKETFAQAITLSLLVCSVLVFLFLLLGNQATLLANNQAAALAEMSYIYIAILIFASPLTFILSINGDSLRCEGHIGFMAAVSLSSVFLNAIFNYLFIAELNMGVAGSAYGTILAQFLSLGMVFIYRRKSENVLKIQVVRMSLQREHWKAFLALGAPSSLSYIGIALMSATILYNLQLWSNDQYATTVGAYGIITRLNTFIFLPLLGLSMAFQSIVGNNLGAKNFQRTNASIKIALAIAFIYCTTIEIVCWLLKDSIGGWFVDDINIITEVGRILPVTIIALFILGPTLMLTMFFQSIGDALRAGILGLSKTYLFTLPLMFTLPLFFGEWGIWFASPSAEILALILTAWVLYRRGRHNDYRFGLFFPEANLK